MRRRERRTGAQQPRNEKPPVRDTHGRRYAGGLSVDQTVSVSVDEKNIAWLMAERIWSSE